MNEKKETLVAIPAEWLKPGAVVPCFPETVEVLLAALKASTFTQGRAAGLEEERAAFEKWATHDGVYPKAIERSGKLYKLQSIESFWHAWQACAALSPASSDAGKDDALTIARDALEEIALAGMSGSGQESEDGMRDWHARRAWEFIGIAARAKTAIDAAIAAQGEGK